MTETDLDQPVASIGSRVVFGLRQGALISLALLVAGLVTERLRPLTALDRGIASTAFLWAIVGWVAVLLVNAIAFEQSQMKALEGPPLLAASAISVLVFFAGLISLEASLGQRIIYLLANSLGALMFWWAIFSLVALLVRRVGD